MSTSILDSINNVLTPDIVGRAATALGESPVATGKAVGATLPAILGGLVRGTSDGNLMSQVLTMLKSPANDGAVLRNPDSILDVVTGRTSAAADLGSSFLSTVFGGRLRTVTDSIGQYAGVRSSSAGSLLSMLAPLALGVLGDRVKRENLDVGGLTRLLASEKDTVAAAMPVALYSVLGLSSPFGEIPRATAGAAATPPPARGSFNWTWPLVGAAALVAIWLFSRGGGDRLVDTAMGTLDTTAASAPATPSTAANTMANWLRDTLPGGVELNAPPEGVEHRLVRFIDDPNLQVNDTTWFDFDRLNFETGSATLRPDSREQLQNVASILKAYPNVHIKIGGYTDNTGNADANMKLSQDRADAVKRELEVLGITPTRLAAEGYGVQHPVADNATDEGRARNRRIALRVTQK